MIVLPSRGRPDSLREFFEVSRPQEPGVVMIDDDNLHEYADLRVPQNWELVVGPRASYVTLLNVAFEMYPTEPWYACWGDDVRCRPVGWDTALAFMADTDGIAYGDDLINGETLCGLPFIGGELVRKVGWLGCPTLKHLYSDTVWRDIGKALDCLRYCPEIITEHLHFSTGKQPFDLTAQERPIAGDRAGYESFLATLFEGTVERCRL